MNRPQPQTQPSLMVRLRDSADNEAWVEFTQLYEPLLMRLMTRNGLQESDARDVCQQTLQAVARDIHQWKPDGRDGSFRRWLFRVAKNRVLKFLNSQRKFPIRSGGTSLHLNLQQQPDHKQSISDVFEQEYRERLVVWAAEQIRAEFQPPTWSAFWLTCVEGQPIAEVAEQLGMSVGNVYVARSRIIARLKSRIQQIDDRGDI